MDKLGTSPEKGATVTWTLQGHGKSPGVPLYFSENSMRGDLEIHVAREWIVKSGRGLTG